MFYGTFSGIADEFMYDISEEYSSIKHESWYKINYKKRITGSFSKLNTFKDGVRIFNVLLMIIIDYKPLLFFGSFGFILLMLSLLIGAPVINEFIITRYVTHVPLAILATGTMIISLLFFTIGMILNVISRSNLRTMLLQIQKADR